MYLIVGFGKLAQSILKLSSYKKDIFVYSRTKEKVDHYQDDRITFLAKEDFHKINHVFLMLPANEVVPFLQNNENNFSKDANFYCFATALNCKALETKQAIIPCKLAGHAKQMLEDDHGLFVVPKGEKKATLSNFLGEKFKIVYGTEEEVLIANKLGTKSVIEMIMNLEEKLLKVGVQKEIIHQTLYQVTRGNIKAFQNNDLGGFAQKIVEEIQKGRQ